MSILYDLDALADTKVQVKFRGQVHEVHLLTVAEKAALEAAHLRRRAFLDAAAEITSAQREEQLRQLNLQRDVELVQAAMPGFPDLDGLTQREYYALAALIIEVLYGEFADPNASAGQRNLAMKLLLDRIRQEVKPKPSTGE